ncbi:MAG: class I SAM-dependent methyltransferase, partial [Methanosarcinales archaeon]|nr:class I SAM-dependent methyltransferase [Methanosarcinales archaeon]
KCKEVTNMRKTPGRLLDIGCATGGFLKVMASYGWKAYGVELNEEAVAFAKREQNLNIVKGDFLEVDFPVGFFDVITLWHVLEHLIDPSAVLKKISSLLKKNGILIYAIPNINSLEYIVFRRWWSGWDVPRHLYTFSFYSMTLLTKKSNFRIIKTKCFCGGYDTFLMSLHNFLEVKCMTVRLRNCIMKIVKNFSFRVISLPFFYLLNLLKKGSTITYYLKKEE